MASIRKAPPSLFDVVDPEDWRGFKPDGAACEQDVVVGKAKVVPVDIVARGSAKISFWIVFRIFSCGVLEVKLVDPVPEFARKAEEGCSWVLCDCDCCCKSALSFYYSTGAMFFSVHEETGWDSTYLYESSSGRLRNRS